MERRQAAASQLSSETKDSTNEPFRLSAFGQGGVSGRRTRMKMDELKGYYNCAPAMTRVGRNRKSLSLVLPSATMSE